MTTEKKETNSNVGEGIGIFGGSIFGENDENCSLQNV